jgi:hypothetical protein
MTNITTDANGAAHNGKGLVKGGGQFASSEQSEPSEALTAERIKSLVVPARPLPAGNSESARTQKNTLKAAATAYAREMMRQNPEFLSMLRSVTENVIPEAAGSYPEVELIVNGETDEEVAYAELKCPWCGAEDGGEDGFHEVGVGERWDKVRELAEDGTSIVFDTDGDVDFEGLHIACSSCDNPVSLPESIDVSYSK